MSVEKAARWTAKKKSELVLQILKKNLTIADICRENDLKSPKFSLGLMKDYHKSGRCSDYE